MDKIVELPINARAYYSSLVRVLTCCVSSLSFLSRKKSRFHRVVVMDKGRKPLGVGGGEKKVRVGAVLLKAFDSDPVQGKMH